MIYTVYKTWMAGLCAELPMYAMQDSISAMLTEFNVFTICQEHTGLAIYNLRYVNGVWTSWLCAMALLFNALDVRQHYALLLFLDCFLLLYWCSMIPMKNAQYILPLTDKWAVTWSVYRMSMCFYYDQFASWTSLNPNFKVFGFPPHPCTATWPKNCACHLAVSGWQWCRRTVLCRRLSHLCLRFARTV